MTSYIKGVSSTASPLSEGSTITQDTSSKVDMFYPLPDETIANIVDYLSFPIALTTLSKVNKSLHKLLVGENSIKPLLRSTLKLQRYHRITDNDLRVLIGIPLRYLHLPAGLRISDVALRYLGYFPLKRLVLARLEITGSGLAYLPYTIKGLSLFKCPNILDRNLAHLRRLTRLEVLYFDGIRIEDERLKDLENLPLKELYFNECEVSDAGIRYLLTLPLEILTLSRCQITNRGILQLARIQSLKTLTLYNSIHINQAGVKALEQTASPQLAIRFSRL